VFSIGYMIQIKLSKVKCKGCGEVWTPRQEEVYQCIKCKSPKHLEVVTENVEGE